MTIMCEAIDLHVSNGPVSSMPNSSHSVPDGAKCDTHPNYTAYYRIQGETDSFGCEYHLMCAECMTQHRKYVEAARNKPSHCDYCKTMQVGCSPMRDYEEGMGGPVYNVCGGCRQRVNDRINEELAYQNEHYGPLDDYYDDSDKYDEPEEPWPDEDVPEILHEEGLYASYEDEVLYRSSRNARPIFNEGVLLVSQLGRV